MGQKPIWWAGHQIQHAQEATARCMAAYNPAYVCHRYMVVEQNGDLVVALPGTTHPMDWSSNLRVGYQPIDGCLDVPPAALETVPCAHAGFYYRSETVPTLTLLHDAAARGCRLVLTGHSLGGAVANLCALTALRAQRAARAAAAAAAAARHASALHSVTDNHSACSANSDVAISPDAALVEVLCISFASPIFANATLVKHIEACGWEECFVNIIVPGAWTHCAHHYCCTCIICEEGTSIYC